VRIDGCRRIPVQALYAYIERLSSNDTGGVDDFAA
jgi:hypothetical protein